MQDPLDVKDSPVALSHGPCGQGTPASVLSEPPRSTTRSLRWRRGSVRRSPRQLCAALLSVVAVAAITLYYFRVCYERARHGHMQRRLAGRRVPPDDDPVLSAIIDMCLDMEEENSNTSLSPQPHPQVGPAGHLEAQPSPNHAPGLVETSVNQYMWIQEAPAPYSSPPVPSFHPEPHTHGYADSPIDAYDAYGGLGFPSPHAEGPSTSTGQFSMQQLSSDDSPPTASDGGISPIFTAVNSASSSPQYGFSPGFSAGPLSHSPLGIGSYIETLEVAVPESSSMHLQQPLFPRNSPESSLLRSPSQAVGAQKRHFEQVETTGVPPPDGFRKRQKVDVASIQEANKFTSGMSGPAASPMVLPESRFVSGQQSGAGYAVAARKAIQRGQMQWFPSATNPGPSAVVTWPSVVSSWTQGTRDVGVSASDPGHQSSPDTPQNIQCSYSACAGQTTADPSGGFPGYSLSQPEEPPEALIVSHPFYRLPTLEPGVSLVTFSRENAFKLNKSLRGCDMLLHYMHSALAKEKLDESQANGLIRIVEGMISHIFHFQRTSVERLAPSDALGILGRRYLMLDALFCATQVLQPAIRATGWWKDLVKVVPSRVVLFPSVYPCVRSRQYAVLAMKLSEAIESLKQGVRPGARETVALKQELLCKGICHPEFKRPFYDPWRDDDMNAGGGQNG